MLAKQQKNAIISKPLDRKLKVVREDIDLKPINFKFTPNILKVKASGSSLTIASW